MHDLFSFIKMRNTKQSEVNCKKDVAGNETNREVTAAEQLSQKKCEEIKEGFGQRTQSKMRKKRL